MAAASLSCSLPSSRHPSVKTQAEERGRAEGREKREQKASREDKKKQVSESRGEERRGDAWHGSRYVCPVPSASTYNVMFVIAAVCLSGEPLAHAKLQVDDVYGPLYLFSHLNALILDTMCIY